MATDKIKVSELPIVGDIDDFEVLGIERGELNKSARANMAQLRGNIGPKGDPGKSAYQSALDGGFAGTELEFNASLASIGNINAALDAINGQEI